MSYLYFKLEEIKKIKWKITAEMENSQGESDLFEIDTFSNNNEKLPISLFREIEADLYDRLMHSSSPKTDQTDGPLDFIKNIVDNVREDYEGFVEDDSKKIVLRILSKIFAILLRVKADSAEKIIKIVKYAISTVLKTWSESN